MDMSAKSIFFLIMAIWKMSFHRSFATFILRIDPSEPMLHEISPMFLSFGIGTAHLRNMTSLPINDNRFINLASHLSPAFIRIGGTDADCLFFNQSIPEASSFSPTRKDNEIISIHTKLRRHFINFTLSGDDYSNIYDFTKKAGLKMLFDLNVLIRTDEDEWDDSNAKEIFRFSKEHNMSIDWQLGNEPNSFHHSFNRSITADQLARDYQHLRNLLNEMGYSSSILVGPEANHINEKSQGEIYAQKFLENDGDSVNFVSWHQYYFNGRTANASDFLNPNFFNKLPDQIKTIEKVTRKAGKKIKMWISETSTAYGGGAPDLSNRFAGGFLWLDKLGYSASVGVDVVIRWTLLGGHYAMVENDLLPNPDWWVSVIFKKFVSEIVLQLGTEKNDGTLRFYAHCTQKSALIYGLPAVTIYGMNLEHNSSRIVIEGDWISKNAKILLYTLTSDYLTSRKIKMNDETLELNPDGSLPAFKPVIIETNQEINLPPTSMTFIVIHGAEIPACETRISCSIDSPERDI